MSGNAAVFEGIRRKLSFAEVRAELTAKDVKRLMEHVANNSPFEAGRIILNASYQAARKAAEMRETG